MKRYLWILVWLVFVVIFFADKSGAVCPEDPNDNGICDTMRVEIWPGDQEPGGFPHFARFPIYITHDVSNPEDSLVALIFPFCYSHTNSSKYCSVTAYWNVASGGNAFSDRGIFRDLPNNTSPVVYNWMRELYLLGNDDEWDNITLNLDGTSHFWLSLIVGGGDQKFGPGSRVLIATMTFKLQDTMSVCIDSCFWPPSARLAFARSDANSYIPRHNLPMCQRIRFYVPPMLLLNCPITQTQHTNGSFVAPGFSVINTGCPDFSTLASMSLSFIGDGVTGLAFATPFVPGRCIFTSDINYTVVDHCAAGGFVRVVAFDSYGYSDTCYFWINLSSTPPELTVPDSIFALVDHISGFPVSATDAENDEITTTMNALWFVEDSLQPPVNPPSYSGNNPGSFSWVPTASDTGRWIASFSATDICGIADTSQTTILVGMTFCGDFTEDTLIDVGDVVYLINYLFREGTAPDPVCRGDVNCDGVTDVGDAVLLINYLYRNGTAPCFGCCG